MKRVASLSFAVFLAACAAAKPPEPPPPAPSPPPQPVRVPTLAIETRYTPDLTLTLRLDGASATGDVALTPLPEGRFDGSPGDLVDGPPGDESLALVPAGDGTYAAPASGLARLTAAPAFTVVVAGRRYPYPQPFGTHPAQCAASLAAARKMDVCVDRRPSAEAVPATCDDAGAAGFRLVVSELADRYAACWSAPTDEAIARLPRLMLSDLRDEACRRLVVAVGPDVATPLGMQLVPVCAEHFPEPTRSRLLLARRTADFPAAFERVKAGSSLDMRQFILDYSITGDPRVEDVRKLAAERFGPRRRDVFLSTRRAVRALGRDGWTADLCDLTSDQATVAIFRGERRLGLFEQPSASRTCSLAKMMMPVSRRRPPAGFPEQAVAIARARTGVKDVRWSFGCSIDHWYFDPPANPVKKPVR